MILLLRKPATDKQLDLLQEEYPDYIKVVVDIEQRIISGGGEYHVDCEEVLLREGSKQSNLWGGGYIVSGGKVDYFAMSNYRPADGRITYEIADETVRAKFQEIVLYYLQDGPKTG